MEGFIFVIALILIFGIFGKIIIWITETIPNSKKYLELKPKLDNLEKSIKEHEEKVEKDKQEWETKIKKIKPRLKKSLNKNQWGFLGWQKLMLTILH